MNKKLLSLYGLKYNPFSPEIPTEALFASPRADSFCWRIAQQVGEGGFACITGDPGTGKSATLRLLAHHLNELGDVTVGVLARPQASVADFYRELGDIFGVTLSPHNRWAGAKALRERWLAHIDASLYRPVLLIDEAQDMKPAVLCELRFLASTDLDARSILTVVLSGDGRLSANLQRPELRPLESRMRTRMTLEAATAKDLHEALMHVLKKAGNAKLMSVPLTQTISEHAAGNIRALMNLGNELLAAAVRGEHDQIDEKLFFEVFAIDPKPGRRKGAS
jgi:type II secretory pathway predicted ATPase ExeA